MRGIKSRWPIIKTPFNVELENVPRRTKKKSRQMDAHLRKMLETPCKGVNYVQILDIFKASVETRVSLTNEAKQSLLALNTTVAA